MGFFASLFGRSDGAPKQEYLYELRPASDTRGIGFQVRPTGSQEFIVWRNLPRKDGLESFRIAGVSFRREAYENVLYSPGWPLMLLPEPDNPVDPNAVAVWDMQKIEKLGYVPKAQAKRIGEKITSGDYDYCLSVWRVLNDKGEPAQVRVLLVGKNASLHLPKVVRAKVDRMKLLARIRK